jgi:S1 RNA binding domain
LPNVPCLFHLPFSDTFSGLLHISNISQTRVTSVKDVLKIDEEVKVVVIKSLFADKIYLRYVSCHDQLSFHWKLTIDYASCMFSFIFFSFDIFDHFVTSYSLCTQYCRA